MKIKKQPEPWFSYASGRENSNRKENKNYGKIQKLKHNALQTVRSTKPIGMRLSSFEFDLQTEWVTPLPVTFY